MLSAYMVIVRQNALEISSCIGPVKQKKISANLRSFSYLSELCKQAKIRTDAKFRQRGQTLTTFLVDECRKD